jgi:CrcB protein
VAAVALGGALGSVIRYLVQIAAVQRFGPGFPAGTFAINVLGSFLIGVVIELAQTRALGMTTELRTFLAVGVLGGFTTFSSFSFEALTLIRDGAPGLATAYALGSVALGVGAALAGVALARAAGG